MSKGESDVRGAGYAFDSAKPSAAQGWIVPAVIAKLREAGGPKTVERVFDIGCGNGAVASRLTREGYHVTGVDPSESGLAQARQTYPELTLFAGSAYDNLPAIYGQFPAVISLEVVEHLYAPRAWAKTLAGLVEPNGWAVVSAPYHGYWKNLALAVTGRMDQHFTALWDHGHIKFWSQRTLRLLLEDSGLRVESIDRLGRIPPLACSMLAVCRKPQDGGNGIHQ